MMASGKGHSAEQGTTSMKRILVAAILIVTALAVLSAPTGAQTEAALTQATSVDSGDDYSCARLSTGQVRCWGDNGSGQLGNDDLGVDTEAPVPVLNLAGGGPLTGVTQISAGFGHTCARLGNGQARCWGDNSNGQLGDDSLVTRPLPVVVLNAAGTAPLTGIVAITTGQGHTCARLIANQARCWGDNLSGQLGIGSTTDADTPRTVKGVGGVGTLTGVLGIDAGAAHTCAVLTSGQARCWGENDEGQVGDNSTTDRLSPRVVRGTNGGGTLTGVVEVAADLSDHSCARLTTGQARCWGDNSVFGQLGNDTLTDSLVPRVVRNPADSGPLTGVLQIELGSNATCARVTGGQVRCWGDNQDGEVGDTTVLNRDLPTVTRNPVDTAPLKNATTLGPGDSHTCAVLANGQVRCWGDNSNGELGNNDNPNDTGLPVVVHLN